MPTIVLTGAAASEERFKRDAPGKRILHLATHGFFFQDHCVSAEAMSRGIGALAEEPAPSAYGGRPPAAGAGVRPFAPTVVGENPLLLSGLVLAGANSSAGAPADGEDGILTAEEIAALDLRGVEMVALSACDTGLGGVRQGEGVFGLRRALEIGGARTVLMSLWPVPDEAARDWMTRFYGARLSNRSVLAASREACRSTLEALRKEGRQPHPYLWAGFVAAGDWR